MADPNGRNSPPDLGAYSNAAPAAGVAMGAVDASGNLQPLSISPTGGLIVAGSFAAGFSTTALAVTTQTNGTGALVWLAPTQTLNVAIGASTAIATTTQAAVTGAIVWLAPTQTVTAQVSGSVQVSGTVSVSGASFSSTAVATTTQSGQSGVTGAVVWLGPAQTITAQVSGQVQVSGTVSVASGTVSVSGLTPTTTASGMSGVTGLPVWVGNPGGNTTVVSGTVTVSNPIQVSGLTPTTTASGMSGVTGLPVWVGNPGGNTTVVSGTVSLVTVSSVGTIVTLLGTVLVSEAAAISISSIVATTTASGLSGVTGLPVWVANPGGNTTVVSLTGSALVSGTVSLVTVSSVGTVVTLLGTINVSGPVQISGITPTTTGSGLSGVAGLPVWIAPGGGATTVVSLTGSALVSGTVSISTAVVATTTQTAATGELVWLAATQTLAVISTVGTVLGTVAVNVVAGGAAPGTTFTGQTSNTAQLVWLAQTQTLSLISTIVTVLGTLQVSGTIQISSVQVTASTRCGKRTRHDFYGSDVEHGPTSMVGANADVVTDLHNRHGSQHR